MSCSQLKPPKPHSTDMPPPGRGCTFFWEGLSTMMPRLRCCQSHHRGSYRRFKYGFEAAGRNSAVKLDFWPFSIADRAAIRRAAFCQTVSLTLPINYLRVCGKAGPLGAPGFKGDSLHDTPIFDFLQSARSQLHIPPQINAMKHPAKHFHENFQDWRNVLRKFGTFEENRRASDVRQRVSPASV